jgi:hypothetical protein
MLSARARASEENFLLVLRMPDTCYAEIEEAYKFGSDHPARVAFSAG